MIPVGALVLAALFATGWTWLILEIDDGEGL